MGRRRGRTGPGGAVVSSLSTNAGGKITNNSKTDKSGKPDKKSNKNKKDDEELKELAGLSNKKKQNKSSNPNSGSSSTASASSSAPSASTSSWLGKSPQQMLREWCLKNNRKRPSFYPVEGSEGIMKCVIHPGRKDNPKKVDSAFPIIVGIGDKSGEEFAALNVLHQVEHGKPIQQLLAPEYRGIWLDLDKRHDEQQTRQATRAAKKERYEAHAKKRETFDKAKVSATVHLSTKSRQVIEDAILQKTNTNYTSMLTGADAADGTNPDIERRKRTVLNKLTSMGFSEFDALYASQQFSNATDATDYLCLTLDESELPATFAPSSEVEVVHFYAESSGKGPLLDPQSIKQFMRLSCLSKLSVTKAMKQNDGDAPRVFADLYNTLTHNVLNVESSLSFRAVALDVVEMQRDAEMDSIKAIYGEDVEMGKGVVSLFPSKWATIITLPEGCPGLHYAHPITVAFIDLDGGYPFSAPAVIVASSINEEQSSTHCLKAAERRLLMRAAAGEMYALRSASESSDSSSDPVQVIHGIISLLTDSTKEQLFRTASTTNLLIEQASTDTGTTAARAPVASSSSSSQAKGAPKHHAKPKQVVPLVNSTELQKMRERRKKLPAHSAKEEILSAVHANQVVVISGATGSGKTTQVPQFLVEDAAEKGEKISIVCTQPRQIAAISVAERVAEERCKAVGDCVGYQVKRNVKKSPNTCLLFCTTGVLLRRLQGNPRLQGLTHVLVDEVHERSVDTDFLLLLLRNILPSRPDLKVVLMSATLEAEKFSNYFTVNRTALNVPPVISIPGRTFPVEQYYLAEAVELSRYTLSPNDRYAKKRSYAKVSNNRNQQGNQEGNHGDKKYKNTQAVDNIHTNLAHLDLSAAQVSDMLDGPMDDERDEDMSSMSKQNVKHHDIDLANSTHEEITKLIDEEQVNVDLIHDLVKRIDEDGRKRNDMGAILIFLPGVAEISAVVQRLTRSNFHCKLSVLPLHSMLSSEEQKQVFFKAQSGLRKVICATNIAETSITVEDVTVVIDTLRVKQSGYDSENGCSTLEQVFVSRAAAKQRAGRAGRVSAGKCYRLVRKHTFENRLRAYTKPEIQRISLEHLILSIMTIIPKNDVMGDPSKFLEKAVDPPDKDSMDIAVKKLLDIGALRPLEEEDHKWPTNASKKLVELTGLGMHLSRLPVDVKIGKLIVYGALFKCLDAVLTIAATVSLRSPFSVPFDKRDEARQARKAFWWGKSDLLVYLKVFNEWRSIKERKGKNFRNEKSFLNEYFLSRKALWDIMEERRQLAESLADTGLCGPVEEVKQRDWERDEKLNGHSLNERVIQAVICAGLYPNVVRLDMQQKYMKVNGGTVAVGGNSKDIKLRGQSMERMFLHPESVNFDQGNYDTRWLAYFSKVLTSKLFLRDSTMVSPYAILLFGGAVDVLHDKGQITVDKWIVFKSPARVGVLARELRKQLDSLLLNKFENASMDLAVTGQGVTDAIVNLLNTETYQF